MFFDKIYFTIFASRHTYKNPIFKVNQYNRLGATIKTWKMIKILNNFTRKEMRKS